VLDWAGGFVAYDRASSELRAEVSLDLLDRIGLTPADRKRLKKELPR
jgi:hypothetical protein